MSKLGFLENLLDGASVNWTPLGELGDLVRGNGLPKSDFTETGVPAIHYGQIYTFYGLSTEKTVSFVSPQTAASLKKVDTGDVVITNTSENFEDVGTPLVYFGKQQAVTGGHATIFKPNRSVLGKYFAYFTQTPAFEKEKRKYAKGTKVIDVSAKDLAKILIPIPCPENTEKSRAIQAEIVRILDSFTELTAELTAELKARKQQYNHYRHQLLSFEYGDVEWSPLGEVCDFKNGFAFKSSLFRDEGSPIVRIKNVSGGMVEMSDVKYFNPSDYRENTEAYVVEKGDILVAMSGATTGKIGYYEHETTAYLNQRVGKFLPKPDKLNDRYLYHFLLSQNQKIYTLAGGGAQPNLSSNALKTKLMIPIPHPNEKLRSLAEQKRIADVLDKLDTLATSLSEGLPREIKLRQQQYEYYRDLLLSFPKPEEAA